MNLREFGEKKLIQQIAKKISTNSSVIRGIGDDAAVLMGSGDHYLLLASDMLLEGTHFRRSAAPQAIGWKALAVNVSDIAAMGGVPRHAVVSLGLPKSLSVGFVERLYQGLSACARRYGINLVGGDTNGSQRLVIDVAILGEVEKKRVVYRSGAKVGDWLLVTGKLGNSVRSGKHLRFLPRVPEIRKIGERFLIHALIDLSDGLGPDLIRLCEASRVGAKMDAVGIPRSKGASVVSALTEGEDFELLMSVGSREAPRLLRWAQKNLPCGLHRVGTVVSHAQKSLVQIAAPDGVRLPSSLAGFQHF